MVDAAELPDDAVIVAVSATVIEGALAWKTAEAAPAGTGTDAGTVSADEVSDRVIEMPPEGAVCAIVTVQEVLAP